MLKDDFQQIIILLIPQVHGVSIHLPGVICVLLIYDVVDALFIVAPIVCGDCGFGHCFCMQYFSGLSSFAIILLRKITLIVFFL